MADVNFKIKFILLKAEGWKDKIVRIETFSNIVQAAKRIKTH